MDLNFSIKFFFTLTKGMETLPIYNAFCCVVVDYLIIILSLLIDSVNIGCHMLNVSHLFCGVTYIIQSSYYSLYLANMINIVSEGSGFSVRDERANKFCKSMDK